MQGSSTSEWCDRCWTFYKLHPGHGSNRSGPMTANTSLPAVVTTAQKIESRLGLDAPLSLGRMTMVFNDNRGRLTCWSGLLHGLSRQMRWNIKIFCEEKQKNAITLRQTDHFILRRHAEKNLHVKKRKAENCIQTENGHTMPLRNAESSRRISHSHRNLICNCDVTSKPVRAGDHRLPAEIRTLVGRNKGDTGKWQPENCQTENLPQAAATCTLR